MEIDYSLCKVNLFKCAFLYVCVIHKGAVAQLLPPSSTHHFLSWFEVFAISPYLCGALMLLFLHQRFCLVAFGQPLSLCGNVQTFTDPHQKPQDIPSPQDVPLLFFQIAHIFLPVLKNLSEKDIRKYPSWDIMLWYLDNIGDIWWNNIGDILVK